MGLILDEMYQPSFKGVQFIWKSGDHTGGRKTITHEYPKKDFRDIEDMGLSLRTFTVNAIIQGVFYYSEKRALENALNSEGEGILVHPFLGNITVKSTGYTVSESLTQVGIARYTMTFSETDKGIYPTSIIDNLSDIADKYQEIYDFIGNNFNTVYSILSAKNINEAALKLIESSQSLIGIGNSVSSITLSDTDFTSEATSFSKDAYLIAGKGGDTGNRLSGLIFDFDALSDDGQTRFDASSQLIGFGSNDDYLELKTASLDERRLNQRLINGTINALAFVNMCDSAKNINYVSEDDLNNTSNKINSSFDEMFDESNNLFTNEVTDKIYEIKNQIRVLFVQKRLVVNKVVEIESKIQPLTILAYSYYGNTEEYDKLITLNGTTNPAIVSGSIKVLES